MQIRRKKENCPKNLWLFLLLTPVFSMLLIFLDSTAFAGQQLPPSQSLTAAADNLKTSKADSPKNAEQQHAQQKNENEIDKNQKDRKNDPKEFAGKITAEKLLENYDRVMGPTNFSAQMRMTAFREDGSSRTYSMKALKAGDEKFRIAFYEPSAVAGQEILRIGDNTWLYLPRLKRSSRLANRDSFQGGDFNNSDVLRVNYQKDYSATMSVSEATDTYKIELRSKNRETSYEVIELWFSKDKQMPVKGLYYGTSGKLLRSAIFKNVKNFGGDYQRPALVVMKNEIIPARYSELEFTSIDTKAIIPTQKFLQTDLGRP